MPDAYVRLQLHARTPDETDPDMLSQVQELIQQLEQRNITQKMVEDRVEKLEEEAARQTNGNTENSNITTEDAEMAS